MIATASRLLLTLGLSGSLVVLMGCGPDEPDAYGNFEATDVVVSAEVGGQLLRFDPDEGDRLPIHATVGLIDTTSLALRQRESEAQAAAARTRTREAAAQIDVLRAQLATARDDYERIQRLFRGNAATAQQLNRAEGEVRVLEERIAAANAQARVARQEVAAIDARIAQIEEEIRSSRIVNPLGGTVLTTYTEAGEFVQRGQPLYKIAALDTLTLRAYVSGAQLAALRIGGSVQVQIDADEEELVALPGRVVWIASEAEFTPTPIQTRDERTEQVYAVKIRVPNPSGALKIGMPGEVVFLEASDGGGAAAASSRSGS